MNVRLIALAYPFRRTRVAPAYRKWDDSTGYDDVRHPIPNGRPMRGESEGRRRVARPAAFAVMAAVFAAIAYPAIATADGMNRAERLEALEIAEDARFEHCVDDEALFSVSVRNPNRDLIARNVAITCTTLPDGFDIVGNPSISGVPDFVSLPDSTGEEGREGVCENHVRAYCEENAMQARIEFLPPGVFATLSFRVRCGEGSNGKRFDNEATASFEDLSGKSAPASHATCGIWTNTAQVHVKRSASYEDGAGAITCELEVVNDADGTIARDVDILEALPQGASFREGSLKATGISRSIVYPVATRGRPQQRPNDCSAQTRDGMLAIRLPFLPARQSAHITYQMGFADGPVAEPEGEPDITCANQREERANSECPDGDGVAHQSQTLPG